MIVNQFNTFPYGGAAAAAKRLHEEINRSGRDISSWFYYHRDEKELELDDSFLQVEFLPTNKHSFFGPIRKRIEKRRKRKIHRQYNFHLANRVTDGEVFAMAQLPDETQLDWASIASDIVHLHWISFFADYPSFFNSIPDEVPIVWTLHDMNAFTGGCHYSSGCSRFELGCGHCGQIKNPNANDLSNQSFRIKKKALQNKNIHVVTPSEWMSDLAQKSDIWPKETSFQVINLGFDLNLFHPVEKLAARKALSIETDAVLIGFGAEDINNHRKGFHHLLNSLKRLSSAQPIECLVFGSGTIPDDRALPKMHQFGYVDSAEKQRLIYSAADIVVVPSREDNQPQIGLEAMACGTPVVGFRAGGIPEYVRSGVSGYLAALGDECDLAKQISRLASDTEARVSMGIESRRVMEREFELGTQSGRYIDLYDRILLTNQVRRKIA